ncbi:MAG: chromate transporter [Betaproteobacteria bacterium]|jgi:chromate transporter
MTQHLKRGPVSRWDLFWSFTKLALQGFGGVLTIVQRELVEKKQWLTNEEFVEDWSIAQVLPGPNVINLGLMIGQRHFGFSGAMTAAAGLMLIPSLVVLSLALMYGSISDNPITQNALMGMNAVVAGLIIATGLKLLPALKKNPLGYSLCIFVVALTVVLLNVFKLPTVWILLVMGGGCTYWANQQLKKAKQSELIE